MCWPMWPFMYQYSYTYVGMRIRMWEYMSLSKNAQIRKSEQLNASPSLSLLLHRRFHCCSGVLFSPPVNASPHRVLTDYRLNCSTAPVRCPRSSLPVYREFFYFALFRPSWSALIIFVYYIFNIFYAAFCGRSSYTFNHVQL